MSLFAKIFASKKSTDKVVETACSTINSAVKGLDMLKFTDEEQAIMSKEVSNSLADFVKTTVNENSLRSKTRRSLSLLIMRIFLLLLLASAVAYPFMPNYAGYLFSLAKSIDTLVMMVAGFFFGGYMVGKHLLPNINFKNHKNEQVK